MNVVIKAIRRCVKLVEEAYGQKPSFISINAASIALMAEDAYNPAIDLDNEAMILRVDGVTISCGDQPNGVLEAFDDKKRFMARLQPKSLAIPEGWEEYSEEGVERIKRDRAEHDNGGMGDFERLEDGF